jgi:hypothetical protein
MRVRFKGLAAVMLMGALAIGVSPQFSASAGGTGNDGCTPGYWKNHPGQWEEAKPGDSVGSVFYASGESYFGKDATLIEALGFGGGSGLAGGQRILLRAAVAAYLNAAHDGLGYPLQRGEFVPDVNAALVSGDRDRMISLADRLDRLNNLGCPLGN